jgi:hypothetical protein
MDPADDLVGEEGTTRMARVKYHVMNGKVTVWQPLEQAVFSLYWHSSARFLVGEPNQLKPMTFGPAKENPFQKQTQLLPFPCWQSPLSAGKSRRERKI